MDLLEGMMPAVCFALSWVLAGRAPWGTVAEALAGHLKGGSQSLSVTWV